MALTKVSTLLIVVGFYFGSRGMVVRMNASTLRNSGDKERLRVKIKAILGILITIQ